ncbi:hypothetical protein L1987_31773 [Smallanthus sonchifolius]|uniref:Uncharacterized protein n=1 Tax=Smallanthus sonchifolius TaxID=185202 RepID=A0ACB9I787_9ASTR|nr:hypothetical protein L1987_31773 [Smallanthus sonchifolius]
MITEGTGIESRLEPSREGLGRQRLLNRNVQNGNQTSGWNQALISWSKLHSESTNAMVPSIWGESGCKRGIEFEQAWRWPVGPEFGRGFSATNRIRQSVWWGDQLVEGSSSRGGDEVGEAFVGCGGAGDRLVERVAGNSLGPPDKGKGATGIANSTLADLVPGVWFVTE